MPDDRDYEVGYGKPPKSSQFKKGRSGNPKGRPKGSLNIATVLDRALREKVTINQNGERKTITMFEAAVKQVVNKAASGDLRAFRHAYALARVAQDAMREKEALDRRPVEDLTDEELEEIIRKWKEQPKGK